MYLIITRVGRRASSIAAGLGGVRAAGLALDLGVYQRSRRIFDHRGDGLRCDQFGVVRQLLGGELGIWICRVRNERSLGEGSGGLDWRCGGLATFRVTPSGCWASRRSHGRATTASELTRLRRRSACPQRVSASLPELCNTYPRLVLVMQVPGVHGFLDVFGWQARCIHLGCEQGDDVCRAVIVVHRVGSAEGQRVVQTLAVAAMGFQLPIFLLVDLVAVEGAGHHGFPLRLIGATGGSGFGLVHRAVRDVLSVGHPADPESTNGGDLRDRW